MVTSSNQPGNLNQSATDTVRLRDRDGSLSRLTQKRGQLTDPNGNADLSVQANGSTFDRSNAKS